jgi:hypothetical protein
MDASLWRIAYIYSIYQLALVSAVLFAPQLLPRWFQDYVKAACVLLAVIWVMMYMHIGPGRIISYYQHMFPRVPRWILHVVDILLHFVPVLLLGLPSTYASYTFAFGVLLLWYIMVRPMMSVVYDYLPMTLIDKAVFILGPLLVITITVIHYGLMYLRHNMPRLG